MINQDELKLLLALLNTIDKHGLTTFNSLNKKLRGTDLLDLSSMNDSLSKRERLSKDSKSSFGVKIDGIIKKMDNDRKIVVIDLISLIRAKSVLKTLSDFSVYLSTNGIQTNKIKSWDEGIYRVVNECLHKDMEFVNKLSDSLTSSNNDDRSLDRWSEIILKPKKIND